MELSDIINLKFIAPATAFFIGMNYAEYGKTKKWLKEHNNTDPYWYKRKKERDSPLNKLNYYLLYPGRKIAYLEHAQEKASRR